MKYLSSCQLLSEEFEKRKSRNPSYSLRAFARDLGVGKTTISDVVNGVRRLSVQNIEIVAAKLGLSEEVVQALKADLTLVSEQPREILIGHELSIIENWYYLAILNLAKLSYSECNAEWISKRLDISLDVAESALQLLMEKGHIENRDGKMFRVSKLLTTSQNVPSSAIAEHHKQSIEKALEAIEDVSVEKRDFTAVTYAVNLDKLEEAKELILNFHRKLGKLLETDSAEEVYRLNIQFFPLTKVSENAP